MLKRLRESRYLSSIMTLVTGSMLAQIITIAVSPVMTRLYSPEEIGVFSLVTAAIPLFGPVLSLRYDLAIVREEEEGEAFSLAALSAVLCVGMSLLVAVGGALYFTFLRPLSLRAVPLGAYLFFLCLITGVINILISCNNRRREYKLISGAYVLRAAAQNLLLVLGGFLGAGSRGLLAAQLMGNLFSLKRQGAGLWQEGKAHRLQKGALLRVGENHRRQALFSAPAALAHGLAFSMLHFMVESLYGPAVLGYYAIAYRVMGLPLIVVGMNVSKAFFERACREREAHGNFRKTYRDTLLLLALIAAPALLGLELLSPWVCEVFLGGGWRAAGRYIQSLAPMFLLRFVAGGLNSSAIVAGRQHIDLGIQLALALGGGLCYRLAQGQDLPVEVFLGMINLLFGSVYIVYLLLFWCCSLGGGKRAPSRIGGGLK